MLKFDPVKLNTFPLDPGVYLMKKRGGAILYIGKAKSIRARLKQYFVPGGDGRWMIPYLLSDLEEIETLVTKNEKEALLLENTLIKKHRPRYNALLKDDKTFIALKLNVKDRWPMLSLFRSKSKPPSDAQYFGPYTSAYAARETLDLLQRLFPMRQCSDQEFARRTRPCILYGMKRCSGPCVGLVSRETYQTYIDGTVQFLQGQRKDLLKNLYQQMEEAAEKLEFERAAELLKTIRSVEETLSTQAVDKPSQGFSGDVLAIYRQGEEVILSQLVFTHGKLHAYKHHNFSHIAESDEELLESVLLQNYQGKTELPKEVLLPIELENVTLLEELISQESGKKITISTPQRGERKALIELAYKNAEAAFKQKKDESQIREKTLQEMQDALRLTHFPERIECFDQSHLSGGEPVSALVAFKEGLPDKKNYRHYKLKSVDPSDDYGALHEVLSRRFGKPKEEQDLPDLIIVDGGKGHLNKALHILRELNVISCDVIGVAKEEGRHDRGMTREQIFLPNVKDPILLPSHSHVLFFLQRIRDEAHRFAITYQKKRRTKTTIRSRLSEIPGIGPVKQKKLLQHFGSIKRLSGASDEELTQVKGIHKRDIAAIREFFKERPF